jgi:hypothetical protein
MKRRYVGFTIVFAVSIMFGYQSGFVNAAYDIHQNHTLISIQSPNPNGIYDKSTIPLIVNVSLIYGTTTTLDELSFQNLICRYSLDNGEWINISSINVTSYKSQPDINYWNGLLHKLNFTCGTTLQDLHVGSHSIDFTLTLNDSWGTYQNTSQTYFTINPQPTPTQTANDTGINYLLNQTNLILIAIVIAVVAVASISLVHFKRRRGET